MLPARSKRYASVDGEIPRERLTGGWQLVLMLLVVLTLLYVVFPKRALFQRLYDRDALDELSLSYVQNLFRADVRNADAALLLARHNAERMDPFELETLAEPYTHSSDLRQRNLARQLLIIAFERQLRTNIRGTTPSRLRQRLEQALQTALEEPLPEALAYSYATLAYRVNLGELAQRLLRPYVSLLSADELERYGHKALGRQDYALASYYFLLARDRSSERTQARRRFQLGLDALVAAGQHLQALEVADQHLGSLESDLPTLRYLVRLALAAGQPVVASRYAKRLVFRLPGQTGALR